MFSWNYGVNKNSMVSRNKLHLLITDILSFDSSWTIDCINYCYQNNRLLPEEEYMWEGVWELIYWINYSLDHCWPKECLECKPHLNCYVKNGHWWQWSRGLYSAMYAQSLIYSKENTNNRDLFIQMVTIVINLVSLKWYTQELIANPGGVKTLWRKCTLQWIYKVVCNAINVSLYIWYPCKAMKQLQWLEGVANPELSRSPSQTPMFEWTAFDMNLGSCVNDIKSKACCPYGYNGRQWPEGAIRGWDLLSEPTAEVEKWSHPDLRKLNMVASLVSFASAQYQRSTGPLSGQLLQRIVPSAIPLLKGPVPWVGVRLGGNVLGGRTWSRLQEPRGPW